MKDNEIKICDKKESIKVAINTIKIPTLHINLLGRFNSERNLDNFLGTPLPAQVVLSSLERFEYKLKGYQQIENDLPDDLISTSDSYLMLSKLDAIRLHLATLYADGLGRDINEDKISYDEIKAFIITIIQLNEKLIQSSSKLNFLDLIEKLLRQKDGIHSQYLSKNFFSIFDLIKFLITKPKNFNEGLERISTLGCLSNQISLYNKQEIIDIQNLFYEIIRDLDKKIIYQHLLSQLLKLVNNQIDSPLKNFSIILITSYINDPSMTNADFNEVIGLIFRALEHYNKKIIKGKAYNLFKRLNEKNMDYFLREFEEDFRRKTTEHILNATIKIDLENEQNTGVNNQQEFDITMCFPSIGAMRNEKVKDHFSQSLTINARSEKKDTNIASKWLKNSKWFQSMNPQYVLEEVKTNVVDTISNLNEFLAKTKEIPIAALSAETTLNLEATHECLSVVNANLDLVPVNRVSKNKTVQPRKIKPRIINFDDEGIGYDVNSPYLYLKEIKRLAEISLDIEFSQKMKKRKMMKDELKRLGDIDLKEEFLLQELNEKKFRRESLPFATQAEKDTRQGAIAENIESSKAVREMQRHTQKRAAKQKKISKVLDPAVCFFQKEIDIFKENTSSNNVYSLNLDLPLFEDMKDDFATDFLATIDYANFRELINSAEEILILINKIEEPLRKMDEFAKNLGFPQNYFAVLHEVRIKIQETFCRNSIIIFFENSLRLFRERTLNSDNNYCLLKMKGQKEKIEFSEPVFLSQFILNNNPIRILEPIYIHLKQFFIKNDDNILFNKRFIEDKYSVIKLLFNLFSGKYYFLSQNRKDKFVKKFFLNFQKYPDFDSIKAEIFKLKWWQFILTGISPFHVFKKGFKELLSKKLFLRMIEEEFKNLEEEFKNIDKVFSIKNIDDLYSIQDRLKSSNIDDKSQSISLTLMNVPQSRQEIINRLNNCEEVKELLGKSSALASNARLCTTEFSKLLNLSRKENEKLSSYSFKKYFFTTPNANWQINPSKEPVNHFV